MQIQSSVRHHKSPAERAGILAAYQKSHESQRAFASQQGIALSTLQRWLRAGTPTASSPVPELIELPNLCAPKLSAMGAGYRLHLTGGAVLEVGRGFDPGEVRVLAQLLREL